MRLLFWKEFHENAKWAAIALLLTTGYMGNVGICLCDNFFMVISFIGTVFGAVLGVVQFAPDAQGDRRALLLHRPSSATEIFLAKILVGTTLYLLAMGIPLLYYIVTTFVPGRVAPHLPLGTRWQLLYPWFADLLTGIVYYLAGALAALRPGRWYGSRCLGFVVAIFASFLVHYITEFWQALVVLFLLYSVTGLAAWGSFLTAGDDDAQPSLARMGMCCTFLIAFVTLSIEGKSLIEWWFFKSPESEIRSYQIVTQTGQVLCVEEIGTGTIQVRDIQGRELDEFQNKGVREVRTETRRLAAPLTLANSESWHGGSDSYRQFTRFIVPMTNATRPTGESWCFVPSLGLLVGYDLLSKTIIGAIGPEGFKPDGEPLSSRFQGTIDYSRSRANPDYLVFPEGVYSVDFKRRRVQLLFTPEAGEVVLGARKWVDEMKGLQLNRDQKSVPGVETQERFDTAEPREVIVGTSRAIYLMNEQGKRTLELPVVYDGLKSTIFLIKLNDPSRFAVEYLPSLFLGLAVRESMDSHLVEYTTDAEELVRTTIPAKRSQGPLPQQPWFGIATSPFEAGMILEIERDILFTTNPGPRQPRTRLANWLLELTHRTMPEPTDLQTGLSNSNVRLYFIGITLNSLIGGVACYLMARRFVLSRSQRVAWLICGLGFGTITSFLFLCIHRPPAFVSCNNCHKFRLVTRETCEHCHEPHAAPPTDGTEIFAALTL